MIYSLFRKILNTIYFHFNCLCVQCNCYESKGIQTLFKQIPDGFFYIRANDWSDELRELINNQLLTKVIDDRFRYGHMFYCITDGETLVSYGWQTNEVRNFYVSEINKTIKFDSKTIVLYDFYTFPQFRRRGFYSLLLHIILSHLSTSDRVIIYALNDNFPSCCAITKAGFDYIGIVSFFKTQI